MEPPQSPQREIPSHRSSISSELISNETAGKPVTFVAPVVAFGILEYIIAFDTIINFEYRLEKAGSFSRRAISYLEDAWGIPSPLSTCIFGVLALLSVIFTKMLITRFFGRQKGEKFDKRNYQFNQPDLSEINVLSINIKKLQKDVEDIKKALA